VSGTVADEFVGPADTVIASRAFRSPAPVKEVVRTATTPSSASRGFVASAVVGPQSPGEPAGDGRPQPGVWLPDRPPVVGRIGK
jgi:hypothetical protein